MGVEVPESVATFLGIFSIMRIGEVGDKTQLVTIGLDIFLGVGHHRGDRFRVASCAQRHGLIEGKAEDDEKGASYHHKDR